MECGTSLRSITVLSILAGVIGLPSRLRIYNGCGSAPMWIANEQGQGIAPGGSNRKVAPGEFLDFETPDGMFSTRYWPKMGCDELGGHCTLGGSGGPGQACVGPHDNYDSCAPPVDTKFEATFGNSHLPCDDGGGQMGGCDHIDVSLVDGFTLPFKLEIQGKCIVKSHTIQNHVIDCAGLTFSQCPAYEILSELGGLSVDLVARNPSTGDIAGCYAPCTKLIDPKWNNTVAHGRDHRDPGVSVYCCPTPPQTAESCRAGAGARSAFVNAVHQFCPGVYAYTYDDAEGLLRCEATSRYAVTFFCPTPMLQEPARASSSARAVTDMATTVTTTGLSAAFAAPLPLRAQRSATTTSIATSRPRDEHQDARAKRSATTTGTATSRHRDEHQDARAQRSATTTEDASSKLSATTTGTPTSRRTKSSTSAMPYLMRAVPWPSLADMSEDSAVQQPVDAYNCSGREEDWGEGKRAWCCVHHGRACPSSTARPRAQAYAQVPQTDNETRFDCNKTDRAWSPRKRNWCCITFRIGCVRVRSFRKKFEGSLREQPRTRWEQHSAAIRGVLTYALALSCATAALVAATRSCWRAPRVGASQSEGEDGEMQGEPLLRGLWRRLAGDRGYELLDSEDPLPESSGDEHELLLE